MAFFDTIPHDQLMRSVARRIVDKGILKLIKARSGRRGSGMKGHDHTERRAVRTPH